MNDAYGPLYQQLRTERLEFANHTCELALHGREVCKDYRIECHHKDGESYKRCRNGLATINDLIILCEHCHDVVTDFQRVQRFSGHAYSVPKEPEAQGEIRHGLEYTKVSIDREIAPSYEERSNRQPIEQVCKGNEGNHREA